jgi:regulator of sirC expression with transglutaminase-like and TPR domain
LVVAPNIARADTFKANLSVLAGLFAQPEERIDLAAAKLTIDKMIDPSVDVDATRATLRRMADDINRHLPPSASNMQRLLVLHDYLYEPGPWNHGQVFAYDLDDPLGKNIKNKLLATYLATHKGNCVSMPLLVVILGQLIGLDARAATVPMHVFVKYRGDDGEYHNFEATSGGTKTDSSFREETPMTDKAIANGLYLRPLTRKETVALMMETLVEFYKPQPEQRIQVADLILRTNPRAVDAMLAKGSADATILKRDFQARYPSPSMIPEAERARFMELASDNRHWYEKAEALGWRQPSPGTDEKYLERIQQVKAARKQDQLN